MITTDGDYIIEIGYGKLDRTISENRYDDDGQAATTQAPSRTSWSPTTPTTTSADKAGSSVDKTKAYLPHLGGSSNAR